MGFHKSPGAYIEKEHPEGISEKLNVSTADLMNIYALHRMRRMEPNYLQIKIKNVNVASFYTGFSFKHYVGRPNYCITVFLSPDDNPSGDFEGMLRRIAFDLLPKQEEFDFETKFVSYYEQLRIESIEPYWEEHLEGEGSKIATISADDIDETETIQTPEFEQQELEELSFDKQFEQFEKDELKEEVKDLQKMINEKNEKIRELTRQITEKVGESSEHSAEVQLLQGQLDDANKRLDEWAEKLADFNEKNAILMETVRKLTEMSSDQNEEMERQGSLIIELKKKIEDKDDLIQELQNKFMNAKTEAAGKANEVIERLTMENQTHLDTITELKLEIKSLKSQIEEAEKIHNEFSEQIIELKKDIKVLRRERDHYKKIVKENDLL
ncbi:MAG: hypothetical protein ACTSR8_20490 [Promethearchaeota archaeon]